MYMNEPGDTANNPICVVHDSESGGVWAFMYMRKGGTEYASSKVSAIITDLGYAKVMLKSDQEPAIKDLSEHANKQRWEDLQNIKRGVNKRLGQGGHSGSYPLKVAA